MPRFFSSSIQSDVVARWFLRAVTEPASCTAPPYNSSFSVNVVLPASGCEMMANVRRFEISSVMLTKVGNGNRETGVDKEGKRGFPNQSVKRRQRLRPKTAEATTDQERQPPRRGCG